ncbi:MAG: hypothetical protein ACXAC8_14540 [Candidatus Hodarchaeales archaeon]
MNLNRKNCLILVLIFCVASNKAISVIGVVNRFVPSVEGEVWEKEFKITSSDENFVAMIQMRALAIYQVNFRIDEVNDDYSLRCIYYHPPNDSVYNIKQDREKHEVTINDGDFILFSLTSNVHLEASHITVDYDPRKNSNKTFPIGGFSGKIVITVDTIGLADNSWYRTEIKLNQNTSSFDFILDTFTAINAEIRPIGYGAKVNLVVNSSIQSNGSFQISTNSKYANFSSMVILPGTEQEQTFFLYNDLGDALAEVPISVGLQNDSAVIFGKITVYFLQKGTPVSADFGYNLIEIVVLMIFMIKLRFLKLGRKAAKNR